MSKSRLLVSIFGLLVVLAGVAAAEHPASISYDNVFALRVNPLGVGDDFRARYRVGLYPSPRPLLASNFFGVVVPLLAAPSFVRPGIGVELQPLSVLQLYVGYEPTLTFGAVGALHSYRSPDADVGFGPVQLGGPPSMPGDLYRTVVHQLVLGATVQAAWRWLGFRSSWRAQLVDAQLRNGDTVFYDQLYGLLLPRSGWMLHGETAAVYRSSFGLTAGLQYILTATWYPASAYAAGEPHTNPNTPIQKLGPVVAYTFARERRGRFEAPTLSLLVAWYLEDRYRAGQLVSQAIPMVGVAFSFRGTLWSTVRP
ncbi:MAG TPA: hypothetical protein VN947_32915 [Polyangia bacterium]|nr:hypothetical protein [Polyangia bacterium]